MSLSARVIRAIRVALGNKALAESIASEVDDAAAGIFPDQSISTVEIEDDAITKAKLAPDVYGAGLKSVAGAIAVDVDGVTIEVSGGNKVQIKADGVSAVKLAADVAGDGLSQAGTGELDVNVDGSTIEIDGVTGKVQVKDGGITKDKIDSTCAGAGLAQAVGGELDVDVDATTVEVDGVTGKVQIVDAGIDKTKIAADVAGAGLAQAVGGELDVNVDGSTVEISLGNEVQVKDGGVALAKFASGCAPVQIVVSVGDFTTTGGGGAVEDFADAAVVGTDSVVAWIRKVGAAPVTLDSVVTAAGKITVTYSADPGADHEVGYIVYRAAA